MAVVALVLWGNAHWCLFLRVLLWFLFGIWLLTIIQVVYVKFFPPMVTPLMLRRYFQQWRSKGVHVKHQRQFVTLDAISPHLVNAADAGENLSLFIYDRGFLFKGMQRAYQFSQKDKLLRGGSAISQQTAKNCFLPHSRTMLRKVIEAYYVVLMELLWGKKRIMECYLNVVEWGDGIYGCEAASQHYFHHPAATLDEYESALLVAALPSPLKTNPESHTPLYDHRVKSVYNCLLTHEPIVWNARWEELNPKKIEEGNRGLLFFAKWLVLQKMHSKRKR